MCFADICADPRTDAQFRGFTASPVRYSVTIGLYLVLAAVIVTFHTLCAALGLLFGEQHSAMSALGGIMFEMRTWARCFIPLSRYIAPFYPTPDHIVERMLRVASVGHGDVVFDLGCGDGKVRGSAVDSIQLMLSNCCK